MQQEAVPGVEVVRGALETAHLAQRSGCRLFMKPNAMLRSAKSAH